MTHTTAPELIEALKKVPEGAILEKNGVGNLSIFASAADDAAWLGYVDIHSAKTTLAAED